MKRLSISDVYLPEIQGSENFYTRYVQAKEVDGLMDPLISIGHFEALDKALGPQYHKRVLTLHYIFDGSSPYHSMDSEGNNMEIAPGGLLWNWTGEGLIHMEGPLKTGVKVEGVQLVLRPSKRSMVQGPRSAYIDNSKIPEIIADGVKVRVVCNSMDKISGINGFSDGFSLFHISMVPGKAYVYRLPPNWSGTIFAIEGRFNVMTNYETLVLDEGNVVAMSHSDFEEPIEIFSIAPSQLILISGVPINGTSVGQGASVGRSYSQVETQETPGIDFIQNWDAGPHHRGNPPFSRTTM